MSNPPSSHPRFPYAELEVADVTGVYCFDYLYQPNGSPAAKGCVRVTYTSPEPSDARYQAVVEIIPDEGTTYVPMPISLNNLGLQSTGALLEIMSVTYAGETPEAREQIRFGNPSETPNIGEWSLVPEGQAYAVGPTLDIPEVEADSPWSRESRSLFLFAPTTQTFTLQILVLGNRGLQARMPRRGETPGRGSVQTMVTHTDIPIKIPPGGQHKAN